VFESALFPHRDVSNVLGRVASPSASSADFRDHQARGIAKRSDVHREAWCDRSLLL
jgi:hypothetical protein